MIPSTCVSQSPLQDVELSTHFWRGVLRILVVEVLSELVSLACGLGSTLVDEACVRSTGVDAAGESGACRYSSGCTLTVSVWDGPELRVKVSAHVVRARFLQGAWSLDIV